MSLSFRPLFTFCFQQHLASGETPSQTKLKILYDPIPSKTSMLTYLWHPFTLPLYLTEKLQFPLNSFLPATWASNNTSNLPCAVNKQLNDKERVAAALENPNLRQLVDECLYSNELWTSRYAIIITIVQGIYHLWCYKK